MCLHCGRKSRTLCGLSKGRLALLCGLALVVIGVYARCAVYGPSLLVDASADGASDSPSGDGGGCVHALPPSHPSTDDPSDADIEFLSVVNGVDFGLDGGVTSYDLDKTCTCPGPESCTPITVSQHCDGEGGTDNSGGTLISNLAQLTNQFDPTTVNANFGKGTASLLIRVSGYNGTANDTQVDVSLFVSNGTVPLTDAGANPVPKHDGNDMWSVDPTAIVGSPPPYVAVHADATAYVSGGVLVGSLDVPLGLGWAFSQDFLQVQGAYLTATIVAGAHGYALSNGTIAGRWDTRNLLTGMQVLVDPFNKTQHLCGSDITYGTLKALICKSADITLVAQNDNTGAPCNALSLALGFATEPVQFGGVMSSGKTQPTPCGATYTDQCGP
jgi:hypothetical protein